ncbi:hypothetical protein N0V83_004831 [Neocucurbitaria cava]|uniref:Uncharacterized protein n=1 Tax=Neocucurbitaria cava TaxID=798079 RepID=A0A9W9CND1_9PLEO|nr:hypothetical protein N0V83_004831 [Neocucurbitaria cava]
MLDRALPPALLSLILVISRSASAAPSPYNFLDNYRDPAPSPEDGPPASYHADRDPSRLGYDVGGVVGGYILTVLIWGVLLLTVGRRMRRKALDPPKQLELELQDKPTRLAIKTGPLSPPLSARSWLKKFKKTDSAVGSPQSPVVQSPGSFDQKVLDAHKDQAQADMERLYAAVMDHDERKHFSKVSVEEADMIGQERRRPSAISIARSHDDSPISPVKAIYPPGYHNGPVTAPLPRDNRLHEQQPPASPRSVLSKRSQVSQMSAATPTSSSSKNARFNLKNLRISGPVQKYPGADSDDEARTPLSPLLQRPRRPSSPPTQQNSPTTPYDPSEELDQCSTARTRMDKLSLTTPKTGVPFTPYSPYMPFTPITPVTPSHLVGRKERKMLSKIEGRRRRAAAGEDLVQSPKEIFGDAY